MAPTLVLPDSRDALCASSPGTVSLLPGMALVVAGVVGAAAVNRFGGGGVPLIVASVLGGIAFGNLGIASMKHEAGLAFAAKTVLRIGIVLLGLRLSLSQVADLGLATLAVIVITVSGTFFGVQLVGRRLGLSEGLSILVASGFSICGNSAIASVKSVAGSDEDDVAAAVGLVTLCGTLAIFAVPSAGSLLGLSDMQLGVWTGASVQDTSQVIAVASTAGPAVLAIATAVKLTRVLFLAPIVAGISVWQQRQTETTSSGQPRPALLPLFVVGFLAAMLLRTSGVLSSELLQGGRWVEQYALAAGMVGLGTSVRLVRLRRLGLRPLLLGGVAWGLVGTLSLTALLVLQVT